MALGKTGTLRFDSLERGGGGIHRAARLARVALGGERGGAGFLGVRAALLHRRQGGVAPGKPTRDRLFERRKLARPVG